MTSNSLPNLSKRIATIEESATLAVNARFQAMKAAGEDVVGFAAGEPDFDTPSHIKEAAVKALAAGQTKYTPTAGTPALRQAVADYFRAWNGVSYEPARILVSCGAKHSLFNLILTVCAEGDEVVLPAPYWVSYAEMVKVAGARTVIVPTEPSAGFVPDPADFTGALTPRTKLVILCSPSNPTGAVYPEKTLAACAEALRRANCWILCDEIYHRLVFDGAVSAPSLLKIAPDLADRILLVNGVSKTYAMTGWRIGFAAGPKAVIQAASRLQDHSTSNPTSFAQAGALAALTGNQTCVETMREEFSRRRRVMVDTLRKMPGMVCPEPMGAFYAFPDVSACYGKSAGNLEITDSLSFTKALLETAKVAVVPGSAFAADRHVRLSYATSLENIRKGLARMGEFVAGLR